MRPCLRRRRVSGDPSRSRCARKVVLAVPEPYSGEPRRKPLRRSEELVQSLGGRYRPAGDMNISPQDLDVVKERCEFVYGTTGGGGNSARGTAIAVHAGLE